MSAPLLILLASAGLTQGPTTPPQLEAGKVERESLEFGSALQRTISAQEGDRVEGVAMQLVGDIRLTIRNPQGDELPQFDYASYGYEPFRFRAASTGNYTLTIESVADRQVEFDLYLALVGPEARTSHGRAQQYMRTAFPTHPGLGVLKFRTGSIDFIQTVGTDGYEKSFTARSLFPVEEWELPLARLAVLHLVESGQLGLQAPLAEAAHMPELDRSAQIEHLLRRSSGLRCPHALEQLIRDDRSLGEGTRIQPGRSDKLLLRQRELNFLPGRAKDALQAHTEAQLLIRICETITGESYADWIKRELLLPLGLRDTNFPTANSHARAFATSFRFAGGQWLEKDIVSPRFAQLPRTSLSDLAKWSLFLSSSTPLALRWRSLYGAMNQSWTHTQVGIPTQLRRLNGQGEPLALVRNLNQMPAAPSGEQVLKLLDGARWELKHPGRLLRGGSGRSGIGCGFFVFETPITGSFYSYELDLTVSFEPSGGGVAMRHPNGTAHDLHPTEWPDRASISWQHIRTLDFVFDESGVAQSFRASGTHTKGLLFERVDG